MLPGRFADLLPGQSSLTFQKRLSSLALSSPGSGAGRLAGFYALPGAHGVLLPVLPDVLYARAASSAGSPSAEIAVISSLLGPRPGMQRVLCDVQLCEGALGAHGLT